MKTVEKEGLAGVFARQHSRPTARIRSGLVSLAVLGLMLMGASSAAASGSVTLMSPAPGSSHRAGYDGPITVDFTGVGDFVTYTISVVGPGGYNWQ